MVETSEPKLNIETIIEQIEEELNMEQYDSGDDFSQIDLSQIEYINALIANADLYAEAPAKWPNKLNFFPFNFVKAQRFILKIYGFIFKKQRVVNNSLAQALKATLTINQKLISEVNSLVESIESIKMKLQFYEQGLSKTEQRLSETKNYYLTNDVYIKNNLNKQKQLLESIIEASNSNKPKDLDSNKNDNISLKTSYLQDAFYIALEDKFRGAREDIISKLKVYLPLIEEVKSKINNAPVLDIGCGRGEWLELLQNNDYQNQGIDINRAMVEQCQKRELEVIEADAIEYLKSLPAESLAGITGFHIIEHLPFEVLLELFSETVRVLKKGGIAIFETPNPQNILVASCKFYIDPTHLHPLPSELIKFVAELQGLSKVQILNLNPYPKDLFLKGSEIAERFNEHFYSAQDYSVIGYKA